MNVHRVSRELSVRLSLPADVAVVAPQVRAADREEVWASHHWTPAEALEQAFQRPGMRFTLLYRGEPFGMFGAVRTTLAGGAAPWLLAGDAVEKVAIPFLRNCRDYAQMMLAEFRYLQNYVDVRNTLSVNWLKFCGFTFHAAERYGVEQLPFYRFTMGG